MQDSLSLAQFNLETRGTSDDRHSSTRHRGKDNRGVDQRPNGAAWLAGSGEGLFGLALLPCMRCAIPCRGTKPVISACSCRCYCAASISRAGIPRAAFPGRKPAVPSWSASRRGCIAIPASTQSRSRILSFRFSPSACPWERSMMRKPLHPKRCGCFGQANLA